ncbi:MAG: apolipoprotein N-acyltransferase [Sandaracinaceae bacterium]|nr:apolipoprotein N-acyltransferase [Sandaracinaceae bacterium]
MRRALAAALAGALVAAGGAPLAFGALTWLAPAALLFALDTPRPASARGSLLLGLATGVVANALSMYWVVGVLGRFGGFPLPLALLLAALLWLAQSLPFVVAAWLAAALMRAGARGWLVLPAALTVAGSLAPMIFPWRYGVSQLAFLEVAQVAELGGLPLLDGLVATAGCGALTALRERRLVPALVAALALGLPALYGAARLPAVRAAREAAPLLRVGVAQPNVSIEDKHEPRRFLAQLALLHAQTRALEAAGAELVVWPETAYRFPIPRGAARDREGALAIRGPGVRGPLLVGALTTDGPPARYRALDALGRTVAVFEMGEEARYNSAVAVDADGRIGGVADKVHPLAFGEHTPLWEVIPWLRALPRGIAPGEGPQVLELAGARIGVLNCYEDLLAEHVVWQARSAPELLVNVTNDAWFGDTSAPHLHHMNARMRAIETRRDLVRAVNTGVSGHTAASGEDLARTRPFEEAAFVADARRLRGRTPYVIVGDWPAAGAAGALLALALARRRRGRSARPR